MSSSSSTSRSRFPFPASPTPAHVPRSISDNGNGNNARAGGSSGFPRNNNAVRGRISGSVSSENLQGHRDGNGIGFNRNGAASISGSGSGERRRATTLTAPDRKRRLMMVDNYPGDEFRARMATGVAGEGSTPSRTAAGSSIAAPIDLTSSPPHLLPQPSRQSSGDSRASTTTVTGTTPWPGASGDVDYEYMRPRWQPDDEVSECPICTLPFSFWYRKHHCRKCGRVVCASCSPHRITIPRQFIVRPPELPNRSNRTSAVFVSPPAARGPAPVSFEGMEAVAGGGSESGAMSPTAINPALGGGEEVRLCNPCVPDPNPEPPRLMSSPRRHRSYHSMSVPRSSSGLGEGSRLGRRTIGSNDYPCLGNFFGSYQERPTSTLQQRPLPPDPSTRPRVRGPISERDICPVCNRAFPPLPEDGNEEPREAHIRECIESHAPRVRSSSAAATTTAPTPTAPAGTTSSTQRPSPLPVRMLSFTATEKDCLSHDTEAQECTICMEEYEVGQPLVRLECLCKFHKRCIVDWFERKKECPVHKGS